jgi:hypothetical protein
MSEERFDVFYMAWFGEGQVDDVKRFSETVAEKLKVQLDARYVYVMVSVRELWDGASGEGHNASSMIKLSLMCNVQGGTLPVKGHRQCPAGGEYGKVEEYASLVRFFGGKDIICTAWPIRELGEFQVVVSTLYEAAYESVEEVNSDIWRMNMTSKSLGDVRWSESEKGRWDGPPVRLGSGRKLAVSVPAT